MAYVKVNASERFLVNQEEFWGGIEAQLETSRNMPAAELAPFTGDCALRDPQWEDLHRGLTQFRVANRRRGRLRPALEEAIKQQRSL